MDSSLKEILWLQFGASIDMLENAMVACPDKLWNTGSEFWYKAYHTIFWMDYYLSEEPGKFLPPAPFSLSEFDPSDIRPERVYTKDELLRYLRFARQKCHDLIAGLTDEVAARRFINERRNYSTLEILIHNLRHVQHHAGQLNLLLRQNVDDVPKWVSRTKVSL